MLAKITCVKQEMIQTYGQALFLLSEATNGIGNTQKAALMNLKRLTKEGFEKVMTENKLDAMVSPRDDASSVLAIGGFPAIDVPAGFGDN